MIEGKIPLEPFKEMIELVKQLCDMENLAKKINEIKGGEKNESI